MFDRDGYNAKILSVSRIESIQQTYFLDRREYMEATMLQLHGRVLSLDFFYPLASRVWVTKDDGSREKFQPYKSICDIKNEDGQVIWFGALPQSESLTALQQHLVQLRKRFLHLGATLHVVFYVDNCCSVRQKIKEVWPEAMVLLDPFHWLQRWKDLLRNPTSIDGRLFLALMSRAVLVASDETIQNKRAELLLKWGRPATLSEALRRVPTTAPTPDVMKRNIWSVLNLFLQRDLATETKLASWPENDVSPKPKLVLKDYRRAEIIRNQMAHVNKACLTDPHLHEDSNFGDVVLHRNVGDKCYCCRGSNLNERYHKAMEVDVIGCRSTMGPAVAERLHWIRNTHWNRKANENRNGATKRLSGETEHLALANSMAEQANAPVPFADVSMPRKDPSAPVEAIGYCLGLSSRPNDGNDIIEQEEEVSLQRNDDATDEDEGGIATADRVAEMMAPILQHRRTERRESTMEAFVRQSGGDPWIPFSRNMRTTNAIEREEHRIFREESPKYKRTVAPSAPSGYGKFAEWWESEVAERLRKSIEDGGDESVIIIRPKSVIQLQEHFDYLESIARQTLQPTDDETDTVRRAMNRTMAESRRSIPPVSTALATPVQYPAATPTAGHWVPVGAAMMQPNIFAPASLVQRQIAQIGNVAPWSLRVQQPFMAPPPLKRLRYDWRRVCRACGWQKAEHPKVEGILRFGKTLCTLTRCGICNKNKRQHDEQARKRNMPAGKECRNMGENCVFID